MKIWQKIYLTTLVLFLIMLNAGLFFSARFIYRNNILTQQQQAENECYFLSQNLQHDFSILDKNGRYNTKTVENVIKGYQTFYQKKHITLSVKDVTNDTDEIPDQTGIVAGKNEPLTIGVKLNFADDKSHYLLMFNKELVEFEKLWKTLRYSFVLISLGTSLALCLLLYVLLKRMLSPLVQLNEGVRRIANGEYETQVQAMTDFEEGFHDYVLLHRQHGLNQNGEETHACRWQQIFAQDEVTQLADSVNLMAEQIRIQIDMLESENAKKQQLMDNMAHELRTPLTSIYGYAEYLSKAVTSPEEEAEALQYIMSESKRLEKMGDLMLSMRMYKKDNLQLQPVSCQAVCAHVRELLHGVCEEKQIQLLGMIGVETVLGEEVLLVNLFRNLIENAIHASEPGSKIFWNGYERETEAVFEISDSGVGMTPEEMEHIREPFYRVDKSRSREHGGAGLGLTITYLIIEKLHASITFDSEKEKGTKVTILLQLPHDVENDV